ncbi:MAG: ribulose-phosphate 3-epimerase [Armatimonadetes bacterium]|nr:ribulose-phosphate 3-epimerase [Anaerolineae bacterium]
MNQIRIAPSILSADFTRLGDQIQAAEQAGADLFHIDVMDGRFVPNITMGALIVQAVRRVTTLPLDVHLMIVEPERHIQIFVDAGASAISVHYEASPHLHRTLGQIRDAGVQAGVAINPHTPADVLSEIMDMLDVVIVMTVNPGFSGQAFLPSLLPKIERVRALADAATQPIVVEIDGGVNAETIARVARAGGDVLIAGNAIFNHPAGMAAGIAALRAAQ